MLLHGFPTASYDWHLVWESLCQQHRLIAPDFLGYGFSDKPPDHPYRVTDHADQVESLLAELGVESAGILAHDYGDTVAQELLARRLSEPHSGFEISFLCLLNGGIFPGVHRPTLILKLLNSPLGFIFSTLLTEGMFRSRLSEVFGPQTQPWDELLRDYWVLVNFNRGRRIYHKLIRYMDERWRHKERWVGALLNSPVPLRLIDGASDPISGQHLVEHYRRTVPAADVVCLEGIGHYPQIEAPDRVLRGLCEWKARGK